jgi:hypothetical protein
MERELKVVLLVFLAMHPVFLIAVVALGIGELVADDCGRGRM